MAMMSTFCPADEWGSDQFLNPDMFSSQTQEEQLLEASGMFGLQEFLALPDYMTKIDPIFDATYDSSQENCFSHLPIFDSPPDNNCIDLAFLQSPEIFPSAPKRQKYFHDEQQVQWNSNNFVAPHYLNGYDQLLLQRQVLAPISPIPELRIENQLPAASYEFASGYLGQDTISTTTNVNKPTSGGLTVSAQSIAARERRRRITEKLHELSKLVPGSTKMNTAEMLQAAFQYVKFLQAQVSILKLMKSSSFHQETNVECLQVVASPIVQEKLYSEEKCLVPKAFVEVLAKDHDIESKLMLKDNVAQLLQTNG